MKNAYKVTEYYVGSTENINLDNKQGLFDMFTDSGFLYGTYKTINYLMKKGVTVYQYILSYEGEFSFSEIYGVPPTGVCHADDQLYLWNPWLLGPLSGDDVTGHLVLLSHKEKLDFKLKSIHYKRRAFSIFTSPKCNTFVKITQNVIGLAGI